MWAFGVSPHGLALTESRVWGITPREYAALKREWKQSRLHLDYRFGELQYTLHKAHFEGRFKIEDFLPEKPKESAAKPVDWRVQKLQWEQAAWSFKNGQKKMREQRGAA